MFSSDAHRAAVKDTHHSFSFPGLTCRFGESVPVSPARQDAPFPADHRNPAEWTGNRQLRTKTSRQALEKELIVFERSAHLPFVSEPKKFNAQMRRIARSVSAPADMRVGSARARDLNSYRSAAGPGC